ncbi:hypothetical protein LOTGIDRAFT_169824 [Lottia gigantea]|uniref:GON domain-containing protein n=1 Tax=Lottia gigantea TaxID=225164 RepID=V4B3P1_LOTGI|nr:hypothetical protein LOTGIDRAFT_169824 [Lottia gigantea]ESO82994.1 hypothetical protein LOTGIDRAFT_169824 [Lottia gigantea]
MTVPNQTVIPNVSTALECCKKTISVNSTSFFYNRHSKDCVVSQMSPFHTTNNLIEAAGFQYFYKDAPKCGLPPVVVNATLLSVSKDGDDVYKAYYNCTEEYRFITSHSTCIGTSWSDGVECKALDSCKAIKACNSGYTTDGEYWMYPSGLNHQRARIYCKVMSSVNPTEYLTLKGDNYAEFPPGGYSQSNGCNAHTGVQGDQGKTIFNKIRIYVQNMTVEGKDYSFTSQEFGIPIPYGEARACSTHNTDICPHRGKAKLDITLTGLSFSSSIGWMNGGWQGIFEVVSQTDHEVYVTGDGACGGGTPNGPIKLQTDMLYSPPLTSATEPTCILDEL